jgi:hypothetical protein
MLYKKSIKEKLKLLEIFRNMLQIFVMIRALLILICLSVLIAGKLVDFTVLQSSCFL